MADAHPTMIGSADRPAVPADAQAADEGGIRFLAQSRLRWNLPLAAGTAMVLLSIVLALAAPWLSGHDPLEIADASLSPPSAHTGWARTHSGAMC